MADTEDRHLAEFDRFLDAWSRRDFLRTMGGAAAFTAFLGGGMAFLEACGNTGTGTTTTNVVKGGHLVEGNISDIGNLNPIAINDVISQIVGYRAYAPLLDNDAAGNLLPSIASEVPKVASDDVTYTFKLRKDVKWSDGQALTADDVVYTFQLMYDPKYKAVKSRFRGDLETYLQSVTAADPYTVVFKTTKPYAPFLTAYGTLGILPKHTWEKLSPAEFNSDPMNQVPKVVSGPFIPVSWEKGQQYTMKRNDSYFLGKANLDTYIYKVVPDAVASANQLKTGEIDVGIIDPSAWDNMATAAGVNRIGFIGPSFDYYLQNMDPAKTPKAAIFGDIDVRHALLMALDRKAMADKVYYGQAAVADSSIGGTSPVHYTPKTQYPFDLAKAKKMLDDAGWKPGSDGVRVKNGVRMEWELRTNAGNKVRENLIVVMQEQWKALGCNVTPKPVQFPQLVTQLSSTREFEMILLGISESIDPDQTQLWHSRSIGGGALNGSGYKNAKVDQLLDTAVQTFDPVKRKDLYHQVQDQMMIDIPAPLLTYPKSLWGVSKRVHNYRLGAFNRYGPRPWMKDVFVSDGK